MSEEEPNDALEAHRAAMYATNDAYNALREKWLAVGGKMRPQSRAGGD
jgi:hypothetical protein